MIRVVTGHICSGKSRFVDENATAGSVVIDMDRIALSLSPRGTNHHAYSDTMRDIARAARNAAFDEAVKLHDAGLVEDVWAIHAYPSQQDIEGYRRRGWQVIDIKSDDATVMARARAERPSHIVQELERRLDRPRITRVFRASS